MSRVHVVAIDGPGASGKTVVGLGLAKRLGCRFIDTGAMYRVVTWLALEQRISLNDQQALGRLAAIISIEFTDSDDSAGPPRPFVNGRDLSEEIRAPEVDRAVSKVSMVPGVRESLVGLQRALAGQGTVVMAGRDIGTVVLPDAQLKIFLQASPEERARRRYEELRNGGIAVEYEEVLADLNRRDTLDSGRALSPLVPARDAEQIVTDRHTIEQVIEEIWQLTERR